MKKTFKRIIFILLTIIITTILIAIIIVGINNYKMKHMTLTERLDYVYNDFENDMKSEGMTYYIENNDGTFIWNRGTGNLSDNTQYAIASITKLYTATVIYNLVDRGKLLLDDNIYKYLDSHIINGIHIYKGIDYSDKITIRHLLSHTSGLPDYYTENSSIFKALENNFSLDQAFSFNDVLERIKVLKPHFNPGKKGKAYYSDFNYDLLKVIIENITNKTIEENYNEYIINPLNLKKTYLFTKDMVFNIPGIWVDDHIYSIPNMLYSSGASGGIVANTKDNMIFFRAFMEGKLFNPHFLKEMKDYNYLQFFPLQYGMGIMRFSSFGQQKSLVILAL